MRRAVITGMGAVTAAGADVPSLVASLRDARCSLGPISLFETGDLGPRVAGEVAEIPATHLRPRGIARASRSDRLALVAAEEALTQASLLPDGADPRRLAVSIGSSTGGMLEVEHYHDARRSSRPNAHLRPGLLAATVGAPTDLVAAACGAEGRRLSPSTACSSGAMAIAFGLLWIRSGAADVVIAGGTDALCRMTVSGFHSLKAMSPEPCRPFDRERSGLSLGEGAGVVVLESEDHARGRGARILAEVCGSGISCDASHPTAPHEASRGAIAALEGALRDANWDPREVNYINAHGTGTPQNDPAEARAIRTVLGTDAERSRVSSTKGAIGHLLGAAGSVEAILTIACLRDGFLPPQVGFRTADPECALPFVKDAEETKAAAALSNSYGFGGNNVSLALRVEN